KEPVDRFGTAAELVEALAPLARFSTDTGAPTAPAHATLADGYYAKTTRPGAQTTATGIPNPTPYSLVLTPAPVLERPALEAAVQNMRNMSSGRRSPSNVPPGPGHR